MAEILIFSFGLIVIGGFTGFLSLLFYELLKDTKDF